MLLVFGFAYTKDEEKTIQSRKERMEFLNSMNIRDYVEYHCGARSIAQAKYSGRINLSFPEPITPEDILIWIDGDCLLPFGGTIDYDRSTGNFSAVVYTD
jgi:hypothetical protein